MDSKFNDKGYTHDEAAQRYLEARGLKFIGPTFVCRTEEGHYLASSMCPLEHRERRGFKTLGYAIVDGVHYVLQDMGEAVAAEIAQIDAQIDALNRRRHALVGALHFTSLELGEE